MKTEKTTQLDIGAQYSGKRTNAWVSAYVGRVNDFILFRYDPSDAYISQVDNINATIMGGEAGVSYKLTDNWKTDASLAYSWGRNTEDGKPLPQMPPLEARLGLSWESGNWSSTGLVRLVSSQHRVAINEGNVVGKDFDSSAGFAVVSANAAYRMNKYFKGKRQATAACDSGSGIVSLELRLIQRELYSWNTQPTGELNPAHSILTTLNFASLNWLLTPTPTSQK